MSSGAPAGSSNGIKLDNCRSAATRFANRDCDLAAFERWAGRDTSALTAALRLNRLGTSAIAERYIH